MVSRSQNSTPTVPAVVSGGHRAARDPLWSFVSRRAYRQRMSGCIMFQLGRVLEQNSSQRLVPAGSTPRLGTALPASLHSPVQSVGPMEYWRW
jgi:hypothetical protein